MSFTSHKRKSACLNNTYPRLPIRILIGRVFFVDTEMIKAYPERPEFVYLQPPKVPKSPKYDPYELEIVRHSDITHPYFWTMSSKGVTLFRDGEAGTT